MANVDLAAGAENMGGSNMATEKTELSAEELDAEGASDLPDREAMSLVNANIAVPVNAAVAANVLSDGSTAAADAYQDTPIDQSTGPR